MEIMTAAAIQQEPYEVPEGGLASFLTATEGDWSDKALEGPETGYVIQMAEKLTEYGREGDTELAHVAPGETVVPLEVLDADPELKNRLFAQMRDMGLEPERYVVGSELNSINPETGRPEFFLKKIVKGIKKAVKGVVKVFKKIAPIVLPIALNFMFPGLGAIASGALGSGIGTLVQGGSLKDAFKSALIGGAMGGLASGISGAMGGQGFVEGVKGGLPGGTFGGGAPTQAPIETGVPDFVAGAEAGALPPALDTATVAAGAPVTAQQAVAQAVDPLQQSLISAKDTAAQLGLPGGQLAPLPTAASPTSAAVMQQAQANAAAPAMSPIIDTGASAVAAAPPTGIEQVAGTDISAGIPTVGEQRGFFDKAGDFLFRAGQNPAEVQALKDAAFKQTYADTLARYQGLGVAGDVAQQAALKAAEAAAASAGPELFGSQLLAKYGPSALGITGLMAATGAFEQPEMGELPDAFGGMTGSKLLQMYPQRYGLAAPGSGYVPITAANGGDISSFPRKNGAIYGPGTETSDDVPAMLSDGEFVMTAQAVRGAGNGSRELGMRRMYDMMRKFEGGAVRG
jgi:hypothetical protein